MSWLLDPQLCNIPKFSPTISAPVKHWEYVMTGKNINYWLYFIYTRYGPAWFLLAAALPVAGLTTSLVKLVKAMKRWQG